MKTLKKLTFVALLTVSCGGMPSNLESDNKEDKEAKDKVVEGNVDGYVTPLDISVDGKKYKDSEDFYTKELNRLKAEVKESYPDYELSFDAELGLRDFKSGMYVFLASSGDTGIASEAYVDSTGKFSFYVDDSVDRKVLYTLRASKRIGLRLTKGEEVIQWCYNMFAEKETALENNPMVLRSFVTEVTEYQCSEEKGGIQLPSNDNDLQTQIDIEWKKANDAEIKRTEELNKKTAEEQASDQPAEQVEQQEEQ